MTGHDRALIFGVLLALWLPCAPSAAGSSFIEAVIPAEPAAQILVDPARQRLYLRHVQGVTAIDLETLEIAATTSTESSRDFALNPETNRLYVAEAGFGGGLKILDAETLDSIASVPTGTDMWDVSIDVERNTIYASTVFQFVSVVDGETSSIVATIPISSFGSLLVPEAQRFYTRSSGVGIVDTASNFVVDQIPISGGPVDAIAFEPTTNRIYAAADSPVQLGVIDVATDSLLTSIDLETFGPLTVNPAMGHVYTQSEPILVVDAATNTVVGEITVPGGRDLLNMAANASSNRVYVSVSRPPAFPGDDESPDVLWFVDGSAIEIVDSVELGTQSVPGLAVDETTGRVFVSSLVPPAVFVVSDGTQSEPPRADAGEDIVAECSSPAGAEVLLDGSASTDPDSSEGTNDDIEFFYWFLSVETFPDQIFLGFGETLPVTLPVGIHTIELVVEDTADNFDTDELQVTISDMTPPQLSVEFDPAALWPPNHRMVDVTAEVNVADSCGDVSLTLLSVSSSEADDGTGDGQTTNDIQDAQTGTADLHFALRAERSGNGPGRIYTATYVAEDASGNVTQSAGFVTVQRDREGGVDPIDLTVAAQASGASLQWSEAPGAVSYDAIRGSLESIRETAEVIDVGPVVCIEQDSVDTTTQGHEDPLVPGPGECLFYLVQYEDGASSSYGTESTGKPRATGAGACD